MASIGKHLSVAAQVRRIKKNLGTVVQKASAGVEDTVLTQAALVASEIKSIAPVDPDSETPGALKNSVRLERGSATAKKAVVVKIKAGGTTTQKQGAGGKAYDYARAAAFGTVNMVKTFGFFEVWRARRKGVRSTIRKSVGRSVRGVFK